MFKAFWSGDISKSMDWFSRENRLTGNPWLFLPSNLMGFPVKKIPSSNSMGK